MEGERLDEERLRGLSRPPAFGVWFWCAEAHATVEGQLRDVVVRQPSSFAFRVDLSTANK